MMKLPNFANIKSTEIEKHVEKILNTNRNEIEKILDQSGPITWDSKIRPLETVNDRLHHYWSLVNHLNSVVNTPELREAYNNCISKISDYSTEVGQNIRLYNTYEELMKPSQFSQLNSAQQKIVKDALRDFKLAGVNLPENKKQHYKELMQQLSQLTTQFEENIMDATKAWTRVVTDEKELAGLPETAVAAAKQTADQSSQKGWVFTLEMPSYLAVMTYANSRKLREEMYRSFTTRASDQGPTAGKFDNTTVIEKILNCRKQLAELLGYNNYAEVSLVPKMAKTTDEVLEFLEKLTEAALSQAKEEFKALSHYAKELDGTSKLEAWDVAYYSEKYCEKLYHISQEQLRPYFPEQQVLEGLFGVVKRLFGISIKEKKSVDVWHPDVRFFEIVDDKQHLRGGFYIDLYARPNKRGGAWMDDCQGRRMLDNHTFQLPIAFLTCNLNPPVGSEPALFTHDEVITLFHEFGHGIHHMLTQVNDADAAGIHGVPWDAVEVPSQFLENWCWEKEALDLFAKHYKTGEVLPPELYQNMIDAKNFQSAMMMMRQCEFSLFDFRIHLEFDPTQKNQVQTILNKVRKKVTVVPVPEFNRFQHSFSHIFAGGYAAGYYSYKWAEVLAADAFSKFEENGIFDEKTGREFLNCILEKGGSADPMELFIAFRGRKPSIDALLRQNGIFVGETA